MKLEYIQHFEALAGIKEQLLSDRKLQKDQAKYLVDLILNLEAGYDPKMVIEHTKLIVTPKGALDSGFQKAKAFEKQALQKAIGLLVGKNSGRCDQLEAIVKKMKLQYKAGHLESSNDVEQIILDLLKFGLQPPGSSGHLYKLLFQIDS